MAEEEKKEEEILCDDCGHMFHAKLCFHVRLEGRNYFRCQCKKGVRA